MPTAQRTWTPMILTQLVVVLAVLVAGVTGAGVLRGTDGGREDVLQVISAANASAQASSMRSTFKLEMRGPGTEVTSTGEMFMDNARKIGKGTFELPGMGTMEFVQQGDRAYFKIPGGKTDAAGHHWFGVTMSAVGGAGMGTQDPMAYLRMLSDAEDVRDLGQESVNDIRTTHYRVDVSPERFGELAAKNPDAPAIPAGALDQLEDFTTDLWVDDQNLARRLRMTFAVAQMDVRVSFDMLDYGSSVDVTAPSAGDVTELSNPAELGLRMQGVR